MKKTILFMITSGFLFLIKDALPKENADRNRSVI